MEKVRDLRKQVVDTFKEYGGWWERDRMAYWLDADSQDVKEIYDALERDGLLERKGRSE